MDKKAITETRVRMRNAIIMKGKFRIANTLIMVYSESVSLFRETACLCICHDSRHSLCFRFWQVFRNDARSQSMEWPVLSAGSARAEDFVSSVHQPLVFLQSNCQGLLDLTNI